VIRSTCCCCSWVGLTAALSVAQRGLALLRAARPSPRVAHGRAVRRAGRAVTVAAASRWSAADRVRRAHGASGAASGAGVGGVVGRDRGGVVVEQRLTRTDALPAAPGRSARRPARPAAIQVGITPRCGSHSARRSSRRSSTSGRPCRTAVPRTRERCACDPGSAAAVPHGRGSRPARRAMSRDHGAGAEGSGRALIALTLAGQMVAALIVDHYGVIGSRGTRHARRLAGAALARRRVLLIVRR